MKAGDRDQNSHQILTNLAGSNPSRTLGILCLLACALAPVQPARADARRFTYVYEATTAESGEVELENWITWQNHRFDFRHEVEFGLTDRLQLSVYVADWNYRTGHSDDEGAAYSSSAIELIYNLSNPEKSALGSAIYGELKVGDELLEMEGKIILQKNLGHFVFAYNATLEAEWEGHDLEERAGQFEQTAGISYEVHPQFSVGGELLHEIAFPDWGNAKHSVFYAGPNFSMRAGKWSATVTALAQLTDTRDESDFQVRTIVGYSF